MIRPVDIIRSWWKTLPFNHTVSERVKAKERMNVCKVCPHKSKNNVCGECGCPLLAKQWSHFPCDKWEE